MNLTWFLYWKTTCFGWDLRFWEVSVSVRLSFLYIAYLRICCNNDLWIKGENLVAYSSRFRPATTSDSCGLTVGSDIWLESVGFRFPYIDCNVSFVMYSISKAILKSNLIRGERSIFARRGMHQGNSIARDFNRPVVNITLLKLRSPCFYISVT